MQHGADRQLTTIGRYPVITLSDARTEAKRILAERTLGKFRQRTVRVGRSAKALHHRVHGKNRPRTVQGYSRLLNRHFAFRKKRLSEITYEDVEAKIRKIKAPGERTHALAAVKVFLAWCQKPPRRHIPHNPCEGMAVQKRPPRKRLLNDAELGAIYRTALKVWNTFSRLVALLILGRQRRNEMAHLSRSSVNAGNQTITLPEWITKNKIEHTYPFGPATVRLLDRTSNLGGDLYFLATRSHCRGKPTWLVQRQGRFRQALWDIWLAAQGHPPNGRHALGRDESNAAHRGAGSQPSARGDFKQDFRTPSATWPRSTI